MTVVDAINETFGKEGNIPLIRISNLMKLSWQGDMCCHDGARAMCWRVLLGLISSNNRGLWQGQLADMVSAYSVLKNRVMPSIDKVKDDPLSALSSGDSMSEEWSAYYKNVELINFLKGDLDRLFLTGVDDEYFQSKTKRELLTAILFIWSMEHPLISYRQGMHEILGSILYAVDCENNAWAEIPNTNETLASSFSEFNTEAYAYAIFDRIMVELSVLYDPLPVQGIENQPFVVQYCTKIQEHYLQLLDPVLAAHLEENYIQSQLYGLRWSRLLLGREFTLAGGNQMFRLWDFMFASCYDAEFNSAEDLLDDSAPPNVYSVLANTRIQGYKMYHNVNKRKNKTDRITYVCTPLLAALADCMLAMMIQVREQLLEGDSSIVMATLMRYPEQASVLPVIECADMIRRGVLVRFIDSKGSVLNYNYDTMAPSSPTPRQHGGSGKTSAKYSEDSQSRQITTPQSTFRGGAYQDMGKKMTERISQVSASISDLVQAAIAPMMDGFEDDDDRNSSPGQDPLSAQKASTYRTPTSTKNNNISSNSNVGKGDNPQITEDTSSTSDPLSTNSSSKFDPNIDPLTGARLQISTTTSSTTSGANSGVQIFNSSTAPAPTSSQKGSSSVGAFATSSASTVATNPSYSILFDDHSTSSNTTSASKPSRSGSLSLFKPREWFSSQHHHGNAQSETNSDRRISGGFNMPILHGNGGTVHDSQLNPVPLRKKAMIAQNQTVGDRLHDLADYLMQFSGGNADSGTNSNNSNTDETGQDDACNAVAKRLRALADVLAGQTSVVDYDVKFTNRTLPAVLSSVKLAIVPAVSTATPVSDAAVASDNTGESGLQDSPARKSDANNAVHEESETALPICVNEGTQQNSTESI